MGEFEVGKSYTIVDHATGGIHHYSCLRRTTDAFSNFYAWICYYG